MDSAQNLNPTFQALVKQADLAKRQLQGMSVLNPARVALRRKVRALEEAQRDVLNTGVASGALRQAEGPDRNTFTSYETQVTKAYEMYEGRAEFGAELFGGVVDMRVSFIGGEGLSVVCKSKAAAEWCRQFVRDNGLNGARLIELLTTGELEGKALLQLDLDTRDTGLAKDKGAKYVCVYDLPWVARRYEVSEDERGKVAKITYRQDGQTEPKSVNFKRAVYVRLGRKYWNNPNATPTRLHKVLADFDNFSRGKYDLRQNTHLFAKTLPAWETDTPENAAAINALVQAQGFDIGSTYIGAGKVKYLEPTGGAAAQSEKDVLLALKLISSASGIPMHWLAWPELMSNRATAESLLEVVNAATNRERLAWQEAFKALLKKAAVMAVDEKLATNEILDLDDLEVRLSLVSLALLKQLIEVWQPLVDNKIISKQTYTSLLPGSITYEQEQELIDEEAQEAARRSPMQNGALQDALKNLKNLKDKNAAPVAGQPTDPNQGDQNGTGQNPAGAD